MWKKAMAAGDKRERLSSLSTFCNLSSFLSRIKNPTIFRLLSPLFLLPNDIIHPFFFFCHRERGGGVEALVSIRAWPTHQEEKE